MKLTRYHGKTKFSYHKIMRKLSRYLKQRKLTCYHGETEEIKYMNAWPFRASVVCTISRVALFYWSE